MKIKKPITVTTELKNAVTAYLGAQAQTKRIRPIVTEYKQQVLDDAGLTYAPRYAPMAVGRITKLEHAWMMRTDQSAAYERALHNEHLKHGFKVELGQCPLEMAIAEEIKVMWAICTEAEYMTKVTKEQASKSPQFREYIKTIVELVVAIVDGEDEG